MTSMALDELRQIAKVEDIKTSKIVYSVLLGLLFINVNEVGIIVMISDIEQKSQFYGK